MAERKVRARRPHACEGAVLLRRTHIFLSGSPPAEAPPALARFWHRRSLRTRCVWYKLYGALTAAAADSEAAHRAHAASAAGPERLPRGCADVAALEWGREEYLADARRLAAGASFDERCPATS